MWHLGECNINLLHTEKEYCTRRLRGVQYHFFQSAIKIDIARNQSAIFVFIICLLLIQIKLFTNLNHYENVNIIDMFFPFPGFATNDWVIANF